MKLLAALFLVVLLLTACAPDKPDQSIEFYKQQNTEQYSTLSKKIADLEAGSAAKDKQIAQLTADKANLQASIDKLKRDLAATPTAAQMQKLRDDITSLLETLAVTTRDLESARNLQGYSGAEYENLRHEYNSLVGLIVGINNRTEPITTNNTTAASNEVFYEKWDRLWQEYNLGQYQIRQVEK